MSGDDEKTGVATYTVTEKTRRRRRARGGVPPEIDALADFVRALEQMTPTAQRAAINWLTDRYLRGGKP